MKFIPRLFVLSVVCLFIAGCSAAEETSSSNEDAELTIYTSVYPIQYAAEQIAGNSATVNTVFPPGADAHTYEPASQDIIEIAESDAFIYVGSTMESFSDSIAEALGAEDVKLIELAQYETLFQHGNNNLENDISEEAEETENVFIEGLSDHYHTGDSINLTATIDEDTEYDHLHWFTRHPDEEDWVVVDGYTSNNFEGEAEVNGQQIKAIFYGEDHEVVAESDPVTIKIDDHDGDQDPHIWTDPIRMIQAAEIIKDQLIEINPTEEKLYNENFNVLKEKLTDLDHAYTEVLSAKENTSIIVSHAAFGYLEERYGIHQIPISGLSSTDEPSQRQLTEIIDQSNEHGLEYVLFEQNTSNRLAEIIQNEIGATPLTLHNLEVLTQNDIDYGEDYFSLMESNLEVLDKATQ